jgi:hypothetical protein
MLEISPRIFRYAPRVRNLRGGGLHLLVRSLAGRETDQRSHEDNEHVPHLQPLLRQRSMEPPHCSEGNGIQEVGYLV